MKNPSYSSFFPENSDKKTVTKLQSLAKQCAREYAAIQKEFHFPSLQLPTAVRTRLAEILVDFALDIHSGSGLWTALEKCNTELFGTPLPLVHPAKAEAPSGICRERVQFLLWNLYPQLDRGWVLSHRHVDLVFAAEEVTKMLNGLLPSLPAVSPIKKFLDKPNDYGWEVKKKLIWLGMHSYLFRLHFEEYIDEEVEGEPQVSHIDDFICQHTTSWSGLGVNDILAACLDVPDEQRNELRSWYLRHCSVYKITKTDKEITEAVNLVTDTPYRIREGAPSHPRPKHFRPNMTVYGNLVPWRGEWYWSGTQQDLTPYPAKGIAEVLRNLKQNTQFVARYWKEREEKVRQVAEEHYRQALASYGNDLTVLPNGRAWEQAQIKWLTAHAKACGHKGKIPRISVPEHLKKCKTGIGVFLDPVEGQETMENFNAIRNGLKKNGQTCTPDEEATIRDWLDSESICPAFVYRALKEYGGEESIKYAFRWETDEPCRLEYLLRCRKGAYYRRRFPFVSLVEPTEE